MKKGDFVEIEYVGRLKSGEIFDLTDKELAKKEGIFNPNARYEPVPLIVGAGLVIPGLDDTLLGMKVGESKTVEIEPEKGFGQRDPRLIKVIPTRVFKEEPKPGMVANFSGRLGRVQSVSGGRVRIDFNNPLAGKKLIYELRIRRKIESKRNQIEAILRFFDVKANIMLKGREIEIEIEKPIYHQIKQKIGSLITEYIQGIDKVKFSEIYSKNFK